ncbi:UNVERIFIED_CONTAM: hypothetical protein NCL1_26772 [Trichonephila clavipes]
MTASSSSFIPTPPAHADTLGINCSIICLAEFNCDNAIFNNNYISIIPLSFPMAQCIGKLQMKVGWSQNII